MSGRRLTDQQAAEVIARVRAGERLADLAGAYGVGVYGLRMYCYRAGLTPRVMRQFRQAHQVSHRA
ncbi:MAG: hypothetical protein JSR67_03570 [Proteobacteria bacterium]|nr:hypothetical protein [Pseudomonadota bacterium]